MAARLKRVLMILGVLLYVLSPVDLAPDVMPGLGWLDDLLAVGILLWFLFGTRQDARRSFEGETAEQHREPASPDAYTLLGVQRGASTEEIRAAYRRMVAQYHPDKVSHLGKEFQEMAHQKLIAIRQAYEALMGRANAR